MSDESDQLIDFLYKNKEAAKERAAAEGAVTAIQKDWRAKSRAWQDKRTGRAPVGLGWTAPPESSTATGSAARLRSSMPRSISVSPGVTAPEILLGGVGLHARYPSKWDVSIYPTATLGSAFTGLTLPDTTSVGELARRDVAERLGVDPSELQTSATCMASGGNRLKSLMDYEGSYAIELVAEVTTQIALDVLLGAPIFASVDIAWAGPIQHNTPITVTATYSGGPPETMTLVLGSNPRILAEGDVATLHLIAIFEDGAWRLIATRAL